jgi:hypothetical protein
VPVVEWGVRLESSNAIENSHVSSRGPASRSAHRSRTGFERRCRPGAPGVREAPRSARRAHDLPRWPASDAESLGLLVRRRFGAPLVAHGGARPRGPDVLAN